MSLCSTHQAWANANTENDKQCSMCLWLERNHNSRITELEQQVARLQKIVDQVDDSLVVDWITVKDGDYGKALADLVSWNIQIHDDPQVSEVAAKRQEELEGLRAEVKRLKDEAFHSSGPCIYCGEPHD